MDAHNLLGIAPSATLVEAEDAYRRLLRRYHPDLHQGEGPEAVAAAEMRTRALNAAIRELRQVLPSQVAAAHRSSWPDAGRPRDPDGPTYSWDPFDAKPWDTAATPRPDQPPAVSCPLCDEYFTTSGALKAHVLAAHEMHLDRKQRRRRRRRERTPLPLTLLAPLNLLGALIAATVANMLLETTALSAWIFALTMAPSAIRLFTQD
jgi:uncharacterized C2H2 Zn-finger protein